MGTERGTPVIGVLLAGILLALVVLIGVVAMGRFEVGEAGSGAAGSGAAQEGEERRAAPARIDEPKRIQETAEAGKTYRVVLKGLVESRAEDAAWGAQSVVEVAYVSELELTRKIERNDGRRIVELRTFEEVQAVKLLSEAKVEIDLGVPGKVVLAALALADPLSAGGVEVGRQVLQQVGTALSQAAVDWSGAKMVGQVNGLTGKQVRITFVDGVGVESLEPVGCTLTDDERAMLLGTAVLSDYYIMPQLEIAIGKTWSIDGAQFAGYIDPQLRGLPTGQVLVKRKGDFTRDGKTFAELEIQEGRIVINRSDEAWRRVAQFIPRGRIEYSLDDQIVSEAHLYGAFRVEELSQDHLLFETRHRSEPKIEVQYACTKY